MLSKYLVMAMIATSISALPLNINLGAYSPALVVGDGTISFGGKTDVSSLMNALEGAAVNSAAKSGGAAKTQPQAAPTGAAPAGGAAAQGATEDKTETQVTALQGMGKEIAPRIVKLERSDVNRAAKRDIETLTAALKYAADAIKTSPELQVGTEEAGGGILVKAGSECAGAEKPKMVKREDSVAEPKIKTTVTTMFIRGGRAVGQTDSISTAHNVEDLNGSTVTKREPSPGIDAVNLNMVEGSVAELTFVETKAVDDEE